MYLFGLVFLIFNVKSKQMTLEGEQFCSYRPKSEFFNHKSEKLEIEKGYECETCSSQASCKTVKEIPLKVVSPEDALVGRIQPVQVSDFHFVLGTRTKPPFPSKSELAVFGMGCFRGAEAIFWKIKGVISTHVGYAGGFTPNPLGEEVCSGFTGHAEVVRIVFDPEVVTYRKLLKAFWEGHDPTQGMRQGVDVGTWYRSLVMVFTQEQKEAAVESRNLFQKLLFKAGLDEITTEIRPANEFYYADDSDQQYLAKNPEGVCELGGTGVELPDSYE
jgi:peptide-methionine (S)-S-oxide reductase